MKAIIVEDEKPARDNLEMLLKQLDPTIEIQAKLDSVSTTAAWLTAHQTDLIFLDIHLADDLSFKIFEYVNVNTPVIFTTAFDQYAIRAFRLNSVDYLLKPIDKAELQRSLDKFKSTQKTPQFIDIQSILQSINQPQKTYQSRFMVSRGEKILSVTTDQISYFEGEDRYVYLIKKDGTKYIIDYKLSDLENLLDPTRFYRLNRSFIAHFSSIKTIFNVSKSRVKVELEPPAKREIMVSSENTGNFKAWLNQ
jgi:DNA-binding LytR/AlgR family response regulator